MCAYGRVGGGGVCVCMWGGRRRGVCAYGRVGGGEVCVCMWGEGRRGVCTYGRVGGGEVCGREEERCVCVRREEGRGGSQQKLIPNRGEGRRERVHLPE